MVHFANLTVFITEQQQMHSVKHGVCAVLMCIVLCFPVLMIN